MSTPVTFKEREESIARKKGQTNRQQRQQWQPTFSSYQFEAVPSNRQHYTCYSDGKFDWDDWTTAPPPSQQQIIQPPPAQNIVYKDIKIDKDNIFVFHGKDCYMSTFFESPFKLNNNVYPNVETYYEACKLYCLIGPSSAILVKKAKYAAAAKKIAGDIIRKNYIPRKFVNQWKMCEGAEAVYNATFEKFNQNPELKKKLLDTGNKIIVQSYDKDNILGCGCSEKELDEWFEKNHGKVIKVPIGSQINSEKARRIGKGRNLLGYVCMSIREQFRQDEADLNAFKALSLL